MNSISEKLNYLRTKLSELLPYSLPLKIAVGFLLTALGSSSVLGLLSEFAVYKYALISGFRAPVEGIPYLRATVTLVSLVLIAVALLAYGIAYPFLKLSTKLVSFPYFILKKTSLKYKAQSDDHIEVDPVAITIRDISYLKAVIASILMSSAVVAMSYFTTSASTSFLIWPFNYFIDINEEVISEHIIKYRMIMLEVTFAMSFLCYLSIFKPTLVKWIALLIAAAAVFSGVFIMFNNDLYSKFLNTTGFGGGRHISIHSYKNKEVISGELLIQSNNYYIITLPNNEVIEYPVKNIDKVEYMKSPFTAGNITP